MSESDFAAQEHAESFCRFLENVVGEPRRLTGFRGRPVRQNPELLRKSGWTK